MIRAYPGRDADSSNTLRLGRASGAGGGVRALVGKAVIVGAEARVGWELHLRVNGLLGIQLGR